MMFATASSLCNTYASPYLQKKSIVVTLCCLVAGEQQARDVL